MNKKRNKLVVLKGRTHCWLEGLVRMGLWNSILDTLCFHRLQFEYNCYVTQSRPQSGSSARDDFHPHPNYFCPFTPHLSLFFFSRFNLAAVSWLCWPGQSVLCSSLSLVLTDFLPLLGCFLVPWGCDIDVWHRTWHSTFP